MLLHDARREARVGPGGELVLLDDQDRSRWDRATDRRGAGAGRAGPADAAPGPYQVQAAIAALHDQAADAGRDRLGQIVALYGELWRSLADTGRGAQSCRRRAMAEGSEVGLALIDQLERRQLAAYQ